MTYAAPPSLRPLLSGRSHMAVAGHPLAAAAAMRVLDAGGTAVDAGVAAGFALNVLQPDMANLGGVAPVMLYLAQGARVVTYCGVGTWPAAATREAVARAGQGRIPASPVRWVVPAAVDSWLTVLARYGTMSASEVLAPAIDLAERGYPLHYFLRENLRKLPPGPDHATARATFLPDGLPPLGAPVRQPDLAGTLRRLAGAERGAAGREAGVMAARDAFYTGEIAERVGAFAASVGSFLTASDLAAYRGREAPPVRTTYRGHTVFACGPWCQGPALLQALNIVGGFDLAALDAVDRAHVAVEAVKLALADRNRFYGDPAHVHVPMDRLLSKAHAAELRAGIALDAAATHAPARAGVRAPDTTYVCVADAAGNLFSATPSDSTMLMSPLAPGLGFGVSDRGLQASLDPGDPNVIAPGKRPRMTPNPGLLLGDGFAMAYGTPGGEVQVQAMLQFLMNHLDAGLDLQAAAEAPRWASYAVPATEDPHPADPGRLYVEARAGPALMDGLRARGHDVQPWPPFAALAGGVCAIRRDTATGMLAGGADPRRMSYGAAW